MIKVPVVIRKDYIIYYELVEPGHTFIHVDFLGIWNKHSKQQFLRDLNTLFSLRTTPIYAMPLDYDKKMKKFCKLSKFTEVQKFNCLDGIERMILERVK